MSQLDFHIIIPARYESTRFPGKLLQEIGGKTVIARVYQQALKAMACSVVIATDSDLIYQHALSIGASVVMTKTCHDTGTDRLSEVMTLRDYLPDDIIVNVQGDEPFIAPELIQQVADSLQKTKAPVATLCWPIEDKEKALNPNVVKVVRDVNNLALYFSRAPIPYHRDSTVALDGLYRHIGLYAYRAAFLKQWSSLDKSPIEKIEALEQLRILWSGQSILVSEACFEPLQDINTPEDLRVAAQLYTHQN